MRHGSGGIAASPTLISPVGSDRSEDVAASVRRLAIIVPVCGAVGALAAVFYVWVFHQEPGQDWMVFYTAGRAYLDGHLTLILDGQRFTAALNARFASWLALPLGLHPWVYPPPFILLFLPFAMLPPLASLTVFLLFSLALLLVATGLIEPPSGYCRWLQPFLLLLCPASFLNVVTGQNAFLTAALLVAGLRLLPTRPGLAGAVLGILTFKPQLWLMVPVMLLAGRYWRALAGTTISAILLALASLAAFGAPVWSSWLALVVGHDAAYQRWLIAGRLKGQSVFACASLLGAPASLATLAQAAAIVAAAACVFWTFRRGGPSGLRHAVMFAATMLAAPHASASDGVLLALAASAFLCVGLHRGCRSAYLTIAVALWISPLFNPPALFAIGLATPLLILVFLGCAMLANHEASRDAAMMGG